MIPVRNLFIFAFMLMITATTASAALVDSGVSYIGDDNKTVYFVTNNGTISAYNFTEYDMFGGVSFLWNVDTLTASYDIAAVTLTLSNASVNPNRQYRSIVMKVDGTIISDITETSVFTNAIYHGGYVFKSYYFAIQQGSGTKINRYFLNGSVASSGFSEVSIGGPSGWIFDSVPFSLQASYGDIIYARIGQYQPGFGFLYYAPEAFYSLNGTRISLPRNAVLGDTSLNEVDILSYYNNTDIVFIAWAPRLLNRTSNATMLLMTMKTGFEQWTISNNDFSFFGVNVSEEKIFRYEYLNASNNFTYSTPNIRSYLQKDWAQTGVASVTPPAPSGTQYYYTAFFGEGADACNGPTTCTPGTCSFNYADGTQAATGTSTCTYSNHTTFAASTDLSVVGINSTNLNPVGSYIMQWPASPYIESYMVNSNNSIPATLLVNVSKANVTGLSYNTGAYNLCGKLGTCQTVYPLIAETYSQYNIFNFDEIDPISAAAGFNCFGEWSKELIIGYNASAAYYYSQSCTEYNSLLGYGKLNWEVNGQIIDNMNTTLGRPMTGAGYVLVYSTQTFQHAPFDLRRVTNSHTTVSFTQNKVVLDTNITAMSFTASATSVNYTCIPTSGTAVTGSIQESTFGTSYIYTLPTPGTQVNFTAKLTDLMSYVGYTCKYKGQTVSMSATGECALSDNVNSSGTVGIYQGGFATTNLKYKIPVTITDAINTAGGCQAYVFDRDALVLNKDVVFLVRDVTTQDVIGNATVYWSGENCVTDSTGYCAITGYYVDVTKSYYAAVSYLGTSATYLIGPVDIVGGNSSRVVYQISIDAKAITDAQAGTAGLLDQAFGLFSLSNIMLFVILAIGGVLAVVAGPVVGVIGMVLLLLVTGLIPQWIMILVALIAIGIVTFKVGTNAGGD